jgi:site-specific recombinase XerC
MIYAPSIDNTAERIEAFFDQFIETLTKWSPTDADVVAAHRSRIVVSWLGKYAPGSLRAYRIDLVEWAAWMASPERTLSPIEPHALTAFLLHERDRAFSRHILWRRASTIRQVLRETSLLTRARSLAMRIGPRRRKDSIAAGSGLRLPADLFERILSAIDHRNPRDVRDMAIVALMMDAMARPSEFLGIADGRTWLVPPVNVSDVMACRDGSGRLVLRALDNADDFLQEPVYLPRRVMKCISNWLEIAQIRSGPLFRSFRTGCRPDSLSPPLYPSRIQEILARFSRRVGLKHMLTTGALRDHTARQMLESGMHIESVRRAARAEAMQLLARMHRGKYVAGNANDVIRHHEAFGRVRAKYPPGLVAHQTELPWI